MTWKVVLPGQPPSVNHAYHNVWMTDKSGRRYKGRKRTAEAEKYFNDAVLLIRVAKPSHWNPSGQVQVTYDVYLQRSIDSDNLQKVISDAIERATGVNDKEFLPCIRSRTIGLPLREARVELEIDDLPSLPLLVAAGLPSHPKPSGPSLKVSLPVPESSSDAG